MTEFGGRGGQADLGRWRLRGRRRPGAPASGESREVVLWRPSFSGPLPEGTLVRCGNCGELDPLRSGHTPEECIRTLKVALAEARQVLGYTRAS